MNAGVKEEKRGNVQPSVTLRNRDVCVETKASANGKSFDDLTREGHGMNINTHKALPSY